MPSVRLATPASPNFACHPVDRTVDLDLCVDATDALNVSTLKDLRALLPWSGAIAAGSIGSLGAISSSGWWCGSRARKGWEIVEREGGFDQEGLSAFSQSKIVFAVGICVPRNKLEDSKSCSLFFERGMSGSSGSVGDLAGSAHVVSRHAFCRPANCCFRVYVCARDHSPLSKFKEIAALAVSWGVSRGGSAGRRSTTRQSVSRFFSSLCFWRVVVVRLSSSDIANQGVISVLGGGFSAWLSKTLFLQGWRSFERHGQKAPVFVPSAGAGQ